VTQPDAEMMFQQADLADFDVFDYVLGSVFGEDINGADNPVGEDINGADNPVGEDINGADNPEVGPPSPGTGGTLI